MLFLLDAISVTIEFAQYKIFEIDTNVYYAHSRTVWKKTQGRSPAFYLTKIKLNWYSNIDVPEPLLMELSGYLDGYLEVRRLEAKRKAKPT